jgi:transcriptional regulator with XRE-family HTH domain
VLKIRHIAKPRTVTSNPKRRHNRQQTNNKTTDNLPALRKIKRPASQRTSRHKLQHILFCPTAPKPTHHPTVKKRKFIVDSLKIFSKFANICQVNFMQAKTIGTILRELRETKGLLLREVGAELALDPTILSKIERDERMPTREQVKALSNFYKEQKNEVIIAWLSDKLVYEIQDEELGLDAMKVAEEKIKYGKNQGK